MAWVNFNILLVLKGLVIKYVIEDELLWYHVERKQEKIL